MGYSAEKSILTCKQEFVFVFKWVTNLTLKNLKIYNCGYSCTSFPNLPRIRTLADMFDWLLREKTVAAVRLDNTVSVTIINITVSDSSGYGLLALNSFGNTVIESSKFFRNNVHRKSEINMGGNALFGYLSKKLNFPASLLISNSVFSNGSDNSNNSISFIQAKPKNNFRANGLTVWIYRVKVRVTLQNLFFSGNTGNLKHPSVRISDFSFSTINITLLNCTFKNEGTLKLDKFAGISESSPKNVSFTIKSCNFGEGVETSISICLTFPSKETMHQYITIDNCLFENYRILQHTRPNVAVLEVQQTYVPDSCPPVTVKILRSVFRNNFIPCSRFMLTTEPYDMKACPSIIVSNCTYLNNSALDQYIVYTEGQRNQIFRTKTLALWKYERDYAMYAKRLDQVKFIATIFEDNQLSGETYKGIVGLKNIFAGFSDCTFLNSLGSSLQATISVVSLYNQNQFINNTGKEGGALSLIQSRLHLNEYSTTIVSNNRAEYGGGLYATAIFHNICTLSLPAYYSDQLNIKVKFTNNTAYYSGDSVFYGLFSNCYVFPNCMTTNLRCNNNGFAFINYTLSMISMFTFTPKSVTGITSIPTSLLTCCGNKNNTVTIRTYPGAHFNISFKTTHERNMKVAPVRVTEKLCYNYRTLSSKTVVCSRDYKSDHELLYGGGKMLATRECNNITYSVHSLKEKVYIEIRIDRLQVETPSISYYEENVVNIMAEIILLPCPRGYKIVSESRQKPYCECIISKYFQKMGIYCNIDQGAKVFRPTKVWVGFYYTQPDTITANEHCPFDYCLPQEGFLSLTSLDEQCNNDRSGVLCGACKVGFSLVLGTSNCKECSNVYLLLIIPFALAGIALVVLLLKCNLTVSVGHINGIIFYANIVHVNKALLFTNETSAYKVFTTFIAWLNLDFGIETCFFKNMDTYSKVWLQFVFPVYLWIIIGFIVAVAHFSSRVSRLISSNSVPVLATLFVLSYAKLLRTIIAAVSFTFIELESDTYFTVWLHDANVRYLSPIHSALFFVAILFALGYIIPLTLMFLFSPCIQSWSHSKAFKWVNRIKPFLDANQGPYSAKYRWWSGLLLMLRIVLYSIFASNYVNDPSLSFLSINLIVFPVCLFCLTKQNIYRYKFANYLESLSLLNVVVLCTINWFTSATAYKMISRKSGDYVTCTSIAFAMILFLLIIVYQLVLKFDFQSNLKFSKRTIVDHHQDVGLGNLISNKAPTISVVEPPQRNSLRESLLDS